MLGMQPKSSTTWTNKEAFGSKRTKIVVKILSLDFPFQRYDKLMKILDRIIFYLRIVHSLDYYQATEYPNEDKMPNRIGIMYCFYS